MSAPRRPALIAATQAAEAVAELLRFAAEGPGHAGGPFGEFEVVAKLAEALALAAQIEREALSQCEEYCHDLGQLIAAARRFIEGWAG